jgi:hypothetical protein
MRGVTILRQGARYEPDEDGGNHRPSPPTLSGGENLSVLWAPVLFETPQEFNARIDADTAKGMMGPFEKNLKVKILGTSTGGRTG